MTKIAVLKFPGTNCDLDVVHVLKTTTNLDAEVIWYQDFRARKFDAVVIPGGFSYGDWLRAGAIAAQTKAMGEIRVAIDMGLPVLGICNGFQILVEATLLPGALLSNECGYFVCKWVRLRVRRPRGPWLILLEEGQEIDMPIAHGKGRYYIDEDTYMKIASTSPTIEYVNENPNGSSFNLAGLASPNGLVLGLMPHPERSAEEELTPRGKIPGGIYIWKSIELSLKRGW